MSSRSGVNNFEVLSAQKGSNSGALDCCISDCSDEAPLKRSKAKRCWVCGNKLQSGRGIQRVIDGHERNLHKFCSEQDKKKEDCSDNVYGMEY